MASPSLREVTTDGAIEARPEDVDLLHRLVAIESLSDDEGDAVAELVRQMAGRGFEAEVDAVGNAVGRIGSGERHVVLLGHIDTVPGRIPVRLENGVLHGRGAVDAKGPLCTFVAAATAAAPRLNARVTVVGAVGEERMGSPGATAVAEWPAPDFCVIGEPSGWDAVCLGYRGTLSFVYELVQPSRHTAGPGESAAEQAVAFWNGVVAHAAALNVERGANSTSSTTSTAIFGTITPTLRAMATDGDGMADRAMLSVGLRLPPAVDMAALRGRLSELAGPAEIRVDGAQEGYRSAKTSPLVPPFLRAIRSEGGTPRFTLKLGTSDMTVVGPAWGCPIVAYGPGDAALDHTPEERLELADYARAIRVLTGVLEAL
ncbi:MAG: [LysW]-lysine hydrolase [Chloroflexia bacterium]|nr:[LysW]-lysine hydrolase [Chloroflexia bacterium]